MDFSQIQLFQMTSGMMDYADQRGSVLAENIANADTPGYRPHDVQRPDFASQLRDEAGMGVQLAATHGEHIGPQTQEPSPQTVDSEPYEVSPDGNAVELEQQMSNLAETQLHHEMATEIYRKAGGYITTALGKQN